MEPPEPQFSPLLALPAPLARYSRDFSLQGAPRELRRPSARGAPAALPWDSGAAPGAPRRSREGNAALPGLRGLLLLRGMKFQGLRLRGLKFQELMPQGLLLQGLELQRLMFQGLILRGLRLQGLIFQGLLLRGLIFQGSRLQEMILQELLFQGLMQHRLIFRVLIFPGLMFQGIIFQGTLKGWSAPGAPARALGVMRGRS